MLQRNFACLRLPASFHFANQRSVSISAHFRQQKTNEKEYAEQEKIDERLKEMKEQNFKTKHIGKFIDILTQFNPLCSRSNGWILLRTVWITSYFVVEATFRISKSKCKDATN